MFEFYFLRFEIYLEFVVWNLVFIESNTALRSTPHAQRSTPYTIASQ